MRRILVIAAVGISAAGLSGLAVAARGGSGPSAQAGPAKPRTDTVEVATRDLVEREELDGTLGYGELSDVAVSAQGTLTGLPAEGAIVDRGGAIAEVDGRSIRLLFGTRPLWRPLDTTVSDGPDVRQLEENLVALGHATKRNLTVDDDWTDATTAAVKRWQKALGVEETGSVLPGNVIFRPAAVRVAKHKATVGGPAGSGPVLSVTGSEKVVTVDLDATRRDLLPTGTAVDVRLPDGKKIAGAVRSVASVVTPPAEPERGDKATVEVTIALSGSTDGALDSAPVDVLVTAERAEGVLAVPVEALLALAEGGYAVERVRDAGTELVAVETGAYADGFVQVTGSLARGDKVVVPR